MDINELKQGNPGLTGFEIAVIGMSGKFPGAGSIEEFWENLKHGREGISFFDEDELRETGISEKSINSSLVVKAYGWLEKSLHFAASFFGYSPTEAEIMDPQMRLLHECAYEALEVAGYTTATYQKPIGLYSGASANFPWQSNMSMENMSAWFSSKQLTDKDFLATRIAYKLNLKGPAITLDTACSTSLTAIHLAVQGLISGDCDMALAGGVTALTYLKSGYRYEEGMILSSDGHTRTFDAKANGSIIGDGVGIVVLKRYLDAVADRDTIHAVIKGTAVNNDGNRKAAYTAPSVEGQAGVIRTAQQMAEVDPETITYIEAHGTGTTLGDPVEIEALKSAFNSSKRHFCRIGSVKSNVGHLEMAAGVAGFIKTILALKHKLIPPSLCFETPSPKIDFLNSPFVVNTQLAKWERPAPGIPRRAGVSSFGIGGTNVHVILEEAPESSTPGSRTSDSKGETATRPYQLITLSAKTESSLEQMTHNLANHLKKYPDISLADAAYTLQVGRQVYPHRRILVCPDNPGEAAELLIQGSAKVKTFESKEDNRAIIFMYPGLGSQYVNMGRDLYEHEIFFRQEMERCFEILRGLLGYNIKDILYPHDSSNTSGTSDMPNTAEKNINQPEISQIVTFIFEYALTQLLIRWGIKPYAMIGYSFGEYTAACAAGVFSLTDALKLVVARGRLLQQAPEGSMSSVPLTLPELTPYLTGNKEISLAIDNGPSCVIAGPPSALNRLAEQLKEKKLFCVPVPANRALHSHMMEPLVEEFSHLFDSMPLEKPQIPYISNVTGEWQTPQDATAPAYWGRHLREPVQFAKGMKTLLKEPGAIFVEIGAGRDISTLALRHLEEEDSNPQHRVLNLVRPAQQESSDVYFLLNRIGRLWMYGQSIDWDIFWGEKINQVKRIPLPTYPFEGQLYVPSLFHTLVNKKESTQIKQDASQNRDFEDWFYYPSWKRCPIPSQQIGVIPNGTHWLLFINESNLGIKLAERLKKEHQPVVIIKSGETFRKEHDNRFTINPKKGSDYDLLFNELKTQEILSIRIVHGWLLTTDHNAGERKRTEFTPPNPQETAETLEFGFYSLQYIAQAIAKSGINQSVNIDVITDNMQEVTGKDGLYPEKTTILGAVKIIPTEYGNIKCSSIDIAGNIGTPADQLISQLLVEMKSVSTEVVVAYRGGYRWVQCFEPVRLVDIPGEQTLLKSIGVYLITGGLGDLGLIFAQYLAKGGQPTLILTSRTALPPKDQWETYLAEPNQEDNLKIKIRKIKDLESMGAKVLIFSADAADREQMRQAILQAEQIAGPISGVIHCAGQADGEMIQRRTPAVSEPILAPKVAGTLILVELLKDHPLDFLILCSSIGAILPQIGQVGYCAANAFLDAFAQWCVHSPVTNGKWGPTIAINWDRWQGIGVSLIAEKQHKELTGEELTGGIPQETGIKALHRIINDTLPQVIVTPRGDLNRMVSTYTALNQLAVIQNLEGASISKALRKRPQLDNEFIPPRNESERILAQTWQNFFGIEQIGIKDDFFDLGGDSLKALTILPRIRNTLNVDIPITEFFKRPTIEALAKFIGEFDETEISLPITPAEKKEFYVATPAQKRLYILQQIDPGNMSYNILMMVGMQGEVDRARLENAFRILIQRHEGLRTSFFILKDNPVQRIHDEVKFEIEYDAIRKPLEKHEKISLVSRFIRPFDLTQAPLIRVGVIDTGGKNVVLMVDMHHIVSDGYSHSILTNEFMALYRGKSLPRLKFQYKDYAEWKNDQSIIDTIKKQEEYWKKEFSGDIPILALPTDYPRPELQSFEGEEITFVLEKEETTALKQLGEKERATLYMVLLAAFNIFLAKISDQEDIVVGMDVGGRNHAEMEYIIGMFVNTLPLRNFPTETKRFKEFLGEVKEKTLTALENQEYPFEDLVDTLNIKRDSSRNPLFDVMFSSLDFEAITPQSFTNNTQEQIASLRNSSLDLKIESFSNTNRTAKFDLSLMGKMQGERLQLTFEYCTKLFTAETIQRYTEYFREITSSIVKNPGIPIRDIEIISRENKNRLIKAIKGNDSNFLQVEGLKTEWEQGSLRPTADFDF